MSEADHVTITNRRLFLTGIGSVAAALPAAIAATDPIHERQVPARAPIRVAVIAARFLSICRIST